MTEPTTIGELFLRLRTEPWQMLGRRWNYKSAVLSALVRAGIFFIANTNSGADAALGAATTEVLLRLSTSGFYGALTQSFRRVEPRRTGMLAAMILLPAVAHSLELLVHWMAGTPALAASIAASVSFTALSTSFNLFAMRHGFLIVGDGRRSVFEDLAAMPRVFLMFVTDAARSLARACL